MACVTTTEHYIPVVKNLIKLDSKRYTNYDNVVDFIMTSALTPEQKKMAVHSIAHIFNGLNGLDSSFYKLGKATEIINSVNLLDNTNDYVKNVSKIYGIKEPGLPTLENITKKINALGNISVITLQDLKEPIQLIKNFALTHKFASDEEKLEQLGQLRAALKDVVSKMSKADESYKKVLYESIDADIDNIKPKSEYIPLSTILELAQLDNYLLTLSNGRMVEAVMENDVFYKIESDGSLTEIDESTIVARKQSVPADWSMSNDGREVFKQDFFLSGLTIDSVSPDEHQELLKTLNSMASPSSGIKITAVRLSDAGDVRVGRIRQIGFDEPQYEGLLKRQHETFENQIQQEYLKSTPNGRVLTVSRPKVSEQSYALVGEVLATGQKFYIYSMENYAFVSSDNTTTRLDLSNPEHVRLLKETSVKSTENGLVELTDADVTSILTSAKLYEAFKQAINAKVDFAFDSDDSVDVTDEFLSHYDFTSQRQGEPKTILLKDAVEQNTQLSKEVSVVKVAADGSEIYEEKRKLPVYFYKKVDTNTGEITYTLVPFLAADERIQFVDPNGNSMLITEQVYVSEVLGITNETLDKMFEKENAVIQEKLKNKQSIKTSKTSNFVIRFMPEGRMSYAIAKPRDQFEFGEYFAKYITMLSQVLKSQTKTTALRQFRNLQYDFKPLSSIANGDLLTFEFATSRVSDGSKLQFEIRPFRHKADSRYGAVILKEPTSKFAYNFILDEAAVDKIANALTSQSPLVKAVVAENTSLQQYDLENPDDLIKFYSDVYTLAGSPNASENIMNLVKQVADSQNQFTELMQKTVLDKILKNENGVYTEFIDLLKEDLTFENKGFSPETMLFETNEDGKKYLKVLSPLVPGSDNTRNTFNRSMKNISILESASRRSFKVVSKGPSNVSTADQSVQTTEPTIPETPDAIPQPVPEIAVNNQPATFNTDDPSSDNSDNAIDIDPFSISNGEFRSASPQDIQDESQWLAENLPMFNLDMKSLKDVVDLTKIDGAVLGMFKDKVIYLNEALASKGTLYHEAFHGVFRYLLSETERRALVQDIANDKKHASKFTQDAVNDFARRRNLNAKHDTLVQLIAEEIMADGFQAYMLKEKPAKAKTALQRFFEMLKKLLDFFVRNRSNIDNLYGKIKNGYYKTATIKSNMFEGQVAFELLDGPIRYYTDDKGNNLKAVTKLNPTEQNQLVNMVVGNMLLDTRTVNFDTKFETTIDKILNEIYDINKLIAQKPESKDAILAKYNEKYTKFRFVMGGRMKGIPIYDLNYTGDPRNDNKQNVNIIRLINEDQIDNSLGQHSFERLKAIVKDRYNKADAIELSKIQDEFTLDKDDVEKTFDGENQNVEKDDEKQNVKEELESNFEEGYGQEDRSIDSYVAQIRRFLSTIRNDYVDAELGITVPAMIDGQFLFPTMLKITAGIKPESIITTLGVMADQMIKDGYEQAGRDIKAVYNSIIDLTRPDADGIPQTNKQILNLLVDALHGIELNYVMFNVTTPKKSEAIPEGPPTVEDLYAPSSTTFRLYDKVLDADITAKRNEIVSNFIKNFSTNGNNPEYKKAVKYLKSFHKEYLSKTISDILSSTFGQQNKLNKLTEDLHKALADVGLNIPKSLIELSLLGINKSEKSAPTTVDPKTQEFYDVNENYISQGQYLESDFFLDLGYILDKAYSNDKANAGILKNILDDQNTRDIQISRFMLILKKSSAYITKYDPTNLPPVVKNAEGKSIYRYAKFNPLLQVGQRVNQMSLEDALSDDPYWEHSLRDFINDNPLLGAVLRNENTEEAKKVKVYLDNLAIAMFGGVRQKAGDVVKEGQTFKSIDKRSLHLLQLLAFMNRKTQKDKEGNTITTYFRSFHQLEATQTNFLMSAMYTPYISKSLITKTNTGGIALYQNKYYKIVETLENVIKQEYKRIAREWSRRQEVKDNFEKGTKNDAVNKYNAELDSDGVTAITDDNSLRAYNFNILSDFFAKDTNKKFKDELISFAKATDENGNSAPVPFEEIDTTPLLAALQTYAQEQFDMYLADMVSSELISFEAIPTESSDGDKRPTARTSYYKMQKDLIPTAIRGDRSSTKLTEEYPNAPGIKKTETGVEPIESLLFDAFMNNWNNALVFNQLMDGDIALSVKNAQDYVKRLKKIVATGSNMKTGTHKVAYMNTITAFVHDEYPTYGPYYSRIQIESDFTIKDEAFRDQMLTAYDKAVDGVRENVNGKDIKWDSMMREVFDGQSISTLMHQIDMHDSLGRLDDRALNILIAKHYRSLTEDEIRYLESSKIVNNAKKTVTASRYIYHKNSEGYIDRNDVSVLSYDKSESETSDEAAERIYDELHGLYMSIYDERQKLKDLKEQKGTEEDQRASVELIKSLYKKIHSYYQPIEHRKLLHDILNSMELYQIDQLMDTTATKQATKLPVDVFNSEKTAEGYINFELSSLEVPNYAKYLQVETSGVKDKAKHSVQSKVLLPSDLSEETFRKIIQLEAKRTGVEPTESEIAAMLDVKNALGDYQISLTKATRARLTYFKNVLRKGNDFELGKIYNMIRDSLELQNAPSNILDMFAVKPDGKPVFNPNLSLIRNTLEYYLIAQYSKHVTDEKVAGFKSFHESGFGYNVLVDTETDRVITTEQFAANPTRYADKNRYKSRPLSVSVETQADGTKLYYVEAIVPKPLFENKQQQDFYMKNLTKMFGVRIPTEDKRSMVVLKVVDFVDSSKLNNIIVPQFVHMLSGSDFDIDSLFGRMMAYYKNGKNEFALYGDYSQYQNPQIGKFIEYLHYMAKNPDFAPLIKKRKQELAEQKEFNIENGSTLNEVLLGLNFSMEEYGENFVQKELKSDLKTVKNILETVFELKEESKQIWLKAKEEHELNPEDRELAKTRNVYNAKFRQISDRRRRFIEQKEFIRNKIKIVDAAFEYQAILDVLSKYDIPATTTTFAEKDYENIVATKFQNQNLQASMKMLANEAVFKYLYINQRSSVEQFKNILAKFGIDMKAITQKSNLYTPTNMIASKIENNMNKDGIGIAAVMNKFLALASQYKLELNDYSTIWRYINADGKLVQKYKFGELNDQDQRVISIIGNILGMFADGAKEPIPAALQMNEINTSTTLAMIGVGLAPEFAVAFNFLPEVRKAAQAVQQSQFAISDNASDSYLFYNNAVQTQLQKHIDNNPGIISRLKNLGLLNEKTWDAKPGLPWQGRLLIEQSKVKIEFTPKNIDLYALKNNALSPSDIGFTIKSADTDEVLTDAEALLILLGYYQKQSQQTWQMNKVSSMTNLFKRLNPSITAFDKMRASIDDIRSAKLFTEESVDKLFAPNQVWDVLDETLQDANEQFSKILLERTTFFSPIVNSLKGYFENSKTISNTLTSFLALNRFKAVMPGSRKARNTVMQEVIDKDDKALLETFTPEYWFVNDLYSEVEKMLEKYPENDFLKLLKQEVTKNTATVKYNGKDYNNIGESYIKIISKAKIKGEYATKVADAVSFLYNQGTIEEKLFVKKLFYHEIVRTGLQNAEGSFIAYMPAELKVPLSNYIDEFINGLKKVTEGDSSKLEENFIAFMKQYIRGENIQDINKFFDEMFSQLAYAAALEQNNTKIPTVKDKENVNQMSFGFNRYNLQAAKPIIKNFITGELNIQSIQDAKVKAIRYFAEVFGFTDVKKTDDKELLNMQTFDFKELGDEFVMDFSNMSEKTIGANKSIAKIFGVKFSPGQSIAEDDQFIFPAILKMAGKTYVLQGVDESSLSEDLSVTKSIGENFIDSVLGKKSFTAVGLVAKYKAIPEKYSSDALSPIAFTAEDAAKYKQYINKKEAIVYNTEVVDISKDEKADQDTTGSETNAENTVITEEPANLNLNDLFNIPENINENVEGISSETQTSQEAIDLGNNLLLNFMQGQEKEKENKEVPKLQPGRYVEYKGETYIITQQNESGTWQLYNPLKEGPSSKISVAEKNIKPLTSLAKIVSYRGIDYIVTSKNTIISLQTNKIQKWDDDNGLRKAILGLAQQDRTIIKPSGRPGLDISDENNCGG